MTVNTIVRRGLCGTMLGLLLAAGCAQPEAPAPPGPPKHVIVIVLDALRADHLGAYGYQRDTSPFIDELAAEGVVFERAYSHSSFTPESVSSLFTGRLPSSTAWGTGWHARPAPDMLSLGPAFHEAGFATALFSNSPMLDHPEFYRGFDETYCGAEYGISQLAGPLVKRALTFAEKHAAGRSLMYLHFLDPHGPYGPPDAYYLRFAKKRYANPLDVAQAVRTRIPELVAEGFGPGEARFEDMVTRYDGEIAFVDDHLRKLAAGLRELGTLDDTLVVITSDHGEEFLDHGFVEHAWQLYPESLHVPLIFWSPERLAPHRENGRVSLSDVFPSLIALAELPAVDASLDGQTLFSGQRNAWDVTTTPRPIISELITQSRSVQRSIIRDGHQYIAWWKYLTIAEASVVAGTQRDIRNALENGTLAPVPVWGTPVREELLSLGPGDKTTVLPLIDNAATLDAMRAILSAYQARCPEQLSDAWKARRDAAGLSPEQVDQLESLGYAGSKEQPVDGEREERIRNLGYL